VAALLGFGAVEPDLVGAVFGAGVPGEEEFAALEPETGVAALR
jgi:hypothetical protein